MTLNGAINNNCLNVKHNYKSGREPISTFLFTSEFIHPRKIVFINYRIKIILDTTE